LACIGGLLYHWRENGERFEHGEDPLGDSSESKLREEVGGLKQALSDKTLKLNFFNGALRKVEVRGRNSGMTGEMASTTKSKS
jgi:hypothetical protein